VRGECIEKISTYDDCEDKGFWAVMLVQCVDVTTGSTSMNALPQWKASPSSTLATANAPETILPPVLDQSTFAEFRLSQRLLLDGQLLGH